MCSYDDCDMPTVYSEKQSIKARKQHKCSECKRQIEIGENYHYAFGVWNNDAMTFKTCSNCMAPRAWIIAECSGYSLGDLYSEILEHAAEYKDMRLYRWAVNIKRKWKYGAER